MTTQTETVQHTPGPWTIIPPEPYDGDDEYLDGGFVYPGGIEGSDGNPVCAFGWNGGSGEMFENTANPHLIAAAPDMLAALQALNCSDILGCAESCASGHERWDHVNRKITAARAVIAKALGK